MGHWSSNWRWKLCHGEKGGRLQALAQRGLWEQEMFCLHRYVSSARHGNRHNEIALVMTRYNITRYCICVHEEIERFVIKSVRSHKFIKHSDKIQSIISMGYYKKDVTPLLTHWSYVFLALTHRYKIRTMYFGLFGLYNRFGAFMWIICPRHTSGCEYRQV